MMPFFKRLLLASLPIAFSCNLAATEINFNQCAEQLLDQAANAGVSSVAIEQIAPTLSEVKRVISADRAQPEFSQTFKEYIDTRINDFRIKKGRSMLKTHRTYLDALTRQYGVPPQYIVSFWALESSFGGFKGNIPTFASLATLACDPRRTTFFTKEFIAAAKLFEQSKLSIDNFIGSWAGAMGHTQFMPSTYLAYGVDGDNDGVIDLFNSERDAFASSANYLSKVGWVRNLRWGRQVILPSPKSILSLGLADSEPLANWDEAGVTKANGRPIGRAELSANLLMPMGYEGPAFLVYENFHIMMKWNRSINYALAVGILADKINGAGRLAGLDNLPAALSIKEIKQAQQQLKVLEHYEGKVDGRIGLGTMKALFDYQKANNLITDGYLNDEVKAALIGSAPQ